MPEKTSGEIVSFPGENPPGLIMFLEQRKEFQERSLICALLRSGNSKPASDAIYHITEYRKSLQFLQWEKYKNLKKPNCIVQNLQVREGLEKIKGIGFS